MLNRPSLPYQYAFDLCATEAFASGGPVSIISDLPFYTNELTNRLKGCNIIIHHPCAKDAMETKLIIWVEPGHGHPIPELKRGGRIITIISNPLSRFLPNWNKRHFNSIEIRRMIKMLRKNGFLIIACYGFNSPVSVFWWYLAQLFETLGKSSLADRFMFRMRQAFVVRGAWITWTPVNIILATR